MVRSGADEERRRATRRVATGFAGFVALSAALTAVHSGATIGEAGAVAVVGLAVGVALVFTLLGTR